MPEMQQKCRATLTIPIDGQGRRFGHIVLPWSRNVSGWGSLRIPVAVLGNRSGPTVLLTGGNHGDEFEGPIVLCELARTLDLSSVHGTIIILPALNYPAVKAGTRLSPIDGGNMNRSFRARRDGTITEQIAHFVEQELISRADAVLDFHAGGRTMLFSPFAACHKLSNATQTERARQALLAFGAPIGLVFEELDAEGMLDTAVEQRGKLFLSTELGGGGSTSPETLSIARRGLHNFLTYAGVIDGPVKPSQGPTRLMTNDAAGYIACEVPGLIEYTVEVGASVARNDVIATITDFDRIEAPPVLVRAPIDGVLLGRLHGGLTDRGDFLALIARDL